MSDGKTHLSIVICGHVDAGKSTTTGRLITDLGGIDARELTKLKAEAEAMGKGSFYLAFYMDRQKEERERGVTIACTTKEFYTESYHYTIIDAPGHRDFIKNMISGASQADIALLMVPADGNFEASIVKGNHKKGVVQGQSRQHARLINLLGVDQVAVGINKMDEKTTAKYSEARFTECRDEVIDFMARVGYGGKGKRAAKIKAIPTLHPIIPMSGWVGDNVVKKSDKMGWWKGVTVKNIKGEKIECVTLVDVLEKFVCVPNRDLSKPMRMPVSGVYNIKGAGDVITGRVEQGAVSKDDEVAFFPSHSTSKACKGKVFSIEMHHKNVKQAGPGDNVGLNIKGLDKTYKPKAGDVMTNIKEPLMPAANFTATVQILDIPDKAKVGYCPIGFVRTSRAACKIEKINWRMGKKTGGQKVNDAPFVESNEVAEIQFAPTTPMCVESFKSCKGLGRIAFLEGHGLCMMGKISKVTEKTE